MKVGDIIKSKNETVINEMKVSFPTKDILMIVFYIHDFDLENIGIKLLSEEDKTHEHQYIANHWMKASQFTVLSPEEICSYYMERCIKNCDSLLRKLKY